MNPTFFTKNLLHWYLQNQRDLPWRATKDPYKIWLSEVILQQTRVAQGLPYYQKFIQHFPTVEDLALAPEEKVMRLWQGLGYYSRAKNLHKCSILIHENYGNVFPKTSKELLQLPGIGRYTAAAIASIAFGEVVPVVDGNVFRVLSRVFGLKADISSTAEVKQFYTLAEETIDPNQPEQYNQAIMEFGALQCVPKSPNCEPCVLASICYAKKHTAQTELPVKTKKVKVKNRFFHYLVIEHKGKIILKQRKEKDIWNSLYDFPLLESSEELAVDETLKFIKDQFPDLQQHRPLVSEDYLHILSHQKIKARFYRFKIDNGQPIDLPKGEFYTLEELEELGKPILINKYLTDDIF